MTLHLQIRFPSPTCLAEHNNCQNNHSARQIVPIAGRRKFLNPISAHDNWPLVPWDHAFLEGGPPLAYWFLQLLGRPAPETECQRSFSCPWPADQNGYTLLSCCQISCRSPWAKLHSHDLIHCCFIEVHSSIDLYIVLSCPFLHAYLQLRLLCVDVFCRFKVLPYFRQVSNSLHATETF